MARKRKQQQEEDSGFGPTPFGRSEERTRLTPVDVQQKVFRLAFRGYDERDVDQFLDEVTEDLAALHEDNKRLREELELRGSPAGFEDAKRHAEETVRRAREEAARITAEAERRAGFPAAAGGSSPPPQFLVRERDFLQQLAGLVQSHAETLKGEARRARQHQEVEPTPPVPEESNEDPNPGPVEESPAGESDEEVIMPPWSSSFEEDRGVEPSPVEKPSAEEWAGPSDEDRLAEQRSSVPGYAPEGGEEEEPSLRELFWGEE